MSGPISNQQNYNQERRCSTSDSSIARRKYKRHPKADRNAPERPLTAYVRFAKDWRVEHDVQGLSFAAAAKQVGNDWQNLASRIKEVYLHEASQAWTHYRRALDQYSETKEFQEYAQYLQEFIQNHPDKDIAIPGAHYYLSHDRRTQANHATDQHTHDSVDQLAFEAQRHASASVPTSTSSLSPGEPCASMHATASSPFSPNNLYDGAYTPPIMTDSIPSSLTAEPSRDAAILTQSNLLPQISPNLLLQQSHNQAAQWPMCNSLMTSCSMPLQPIDQSSRFYRPGGMPTEAVYPQQYEGGLESALQSNSTIDPAILWQKAPNYVQS